MSYIREMEWGATSRTGFSVREAFGFVPDVFRAMALLSRIPEAIAGLAAAVILPEGALSRIRKQSMMLAVAAAYRNVYCVAWHHRSLRLMGVPDLELGRIMSDHHQAGLSQPDTALLGFVLKLATRAPWVSEHDIDSVRENGWSDESILEAILVTGLANLFCTLAAGLGPSHDFDPPALPDINPWSPHTSGSFVGGTAGPYLDSIDPGPEGFPLALKQRFGYIPNIFRAQTLRPDLIQAEVDAFGKVLQPEDVLSHVQKECILLVGSAANLNTYCVAAHCEMLRLLGGLPLEESDQIAVDHRQANLSEPDKTLLDFALKLTVRPSQIGQHDIDLLRGDGFTEEQILEAAAVTAINSFFNTIQMGLGTTPDTEPVRIFGQQDLHLSAPFSRLPVEAAVDPDADLVVRVQGGDLGAFEELVNRHSRRIYRTLLAIVGNIDDAEDAMQDTFLKAFQYIGKFEGRSKFSTWLTKIATNTGVQQLRERGRFELLDEGPDADQDFRPRQIQAWEDDPEHLFSQAERRALVESGLMRLPVKYRVVLVLRDIEQLSGEEAASALGLGISALKARLFRGRLMLREVLSSHFSVGARRMAL